MGGAAAQMARELDSVEGLIRAGRFDAATELCVRLHGEPVGRLCMAMLGSQAEAEELAQETFLAAHDAMASFRGEGSVRSFLCGIARHLCIRRLETRTVRERKLHLVQTGEPPPRTPDAEVDSRRRARRVREALGALRPSDREVLLLRFEADLSFREIAGVLDVEAATARQRASRALRQLGRLLEGEGP